MKLRSSRGGVNRLVAILLALIAVMLVIIAIPWWKNFSYRSEVIACEQAMKSAEDGLIIEYLSRFKEKRIIRFSRETVPASEWDYRKEGHR